jgi:hypothetical protein
MYAVISDIAMLAPTTAVITTGSTEYRLHQRFPGTAIIMAIGDNGVPPVISFQPGVVFHLAMPFGREAVLKAVRFGFQWHRM